MLAELQNISKHYDQPGSGIRNVILNQVSLAIGDKDSIAIVGPSGSGKSTLLNLLGTLDKPSSGRVILNGADTGLLDDAALATLRNRFVGFVFQMHHLLPQLTLIENVLLPLLPVKDPAARKRATERAYGLVDRVGLKSRVHQRPFQLSAGECQRTAVVRALVNEPRLLLADEPTGSLDEASARDLGHLLGELNREQELAIVVVTHSTELASGMGKIHRLSGGKLEIIKLP